MALATAGMLAAAAGRPSFEASSFAATTPAAAAGEVAVAQGLGPIVLKNATELAGTPASTPEIVSFILRGRNLLGLEPAVEEGRAPGLTVAQFAGRYGQTATVITALRSYLHRYGIATSVYPDDLDVSASGTAAEFDSALSVQPGAVQGTGDGRARRPGGHLGPAGARHRPEPVPARRHRPQRAGHPRADQLRAVLR